MKHPDGTFSARALDTAEDLAKLLAEHIWPLCTSFEHAPLLHMNDGDKEGDPEYAAVLIDTVDGLQVEGREVGRIRPAEVGRYGALGFIREMGRGRFQMESPVRFRAEPDWHHSCDLCAFEGD